MMDFIFLFFIALLPAIIIFSVLLFAMRESTKSTFMYDLLNEHGGTITEQGISFDVSKDAVLKVGFGSLTIINPDGTMRRFTIGNAFTQKPIITIGGVER